jgi:hypothetical protein
MKLDAEILKYVFTQTVFGGLFFWLLMDTQKKNNDREKRSEQREGKYQEIIGQLTNKLEVVNRVEVKIDKVEDRLEQAFRK